MERPPSLHRVSAPLDALSAEKRALQLESLTNPISLRLLSVLAHATPRAETAETVAAALAVSASDADARLCELHDRGLVTRSSSSPWTYTPAPVAWARYGRLFAPGVTPPEAPESAAVSWAGHPRVIRRIAEQLTRRYRTTFSRETIERHVLESYEELRDSAAGQQYVPMLVNRQVADRLNDIAATHRISVAGVPEVLFVCIGNSGRSQIANAAIIAMAGDRLNARSAGTRPQPSVDATVREAMAEIGLDIPSSPQVLQDHFVEMADYVVTMGCGDACPVFPGRRYLDWEVPDPVGRGIEDVRAVRNLIMDLVTGLVSEIDEAQAHLRHGG